MPSEANRQALMDITDCIARIRRFIGSISLDEFLADDKTYFAVVRALEIISEASRHVSNDIKSRHPEINWIAIRDAGNVYRHGYLAVTETRVWETATKHLAELEKAATVELARLQGLSSK
jgi:uncharacterized protein with HEPN domain